MRSHLETAGEVAARIRSVAHRLMLMADPRLKSYLGEREMLDLEEPDDAAGAPAPVRARRA